MLRNVAPTPVALWKTLTRNRPPSLLTYEKSMSCFCRKPLALRVAQDLVDVAFELGVAEVAELDRHEVAVQAQHRRHADGEVDVGAALREAQLQERVDTCHGVT